MDRNGSVVETAPGESMLFRGRNTVVSLVKRAYIIYSEPLSNSVETWPFVGDHGALQVSNLRHTQTSSAS